MMHFLKSAKCIFIIFSLINIAMLFQTKQRWPFIILNMFSASPNTSDVYRLAFIKPDRSYVLIEEEHATWYLNIYYARISLDIYPQQGLNFILKRQCEKRLTSCARQEMGLIKRRFIGKPTQNDFRTYEEIVYSKIL